MVLAYITTTFNFVKDYCKLVDMDLKVGVDMDFEYLSRFLQNHIIILNLCQFFTHNLEKANSIHFFNVEIKGRVNCPWSSILVPFT